MKAPSQYRFDPMNLASHIYRRHFHDFSDRPGIETFEVEQHELAIRWIQPMDQLEEPLQIHALIGLVPAVSLARRGIEFFQTQQEM